MSGKLIIVFLTIIFGKITAIDPKIFFQENVNSWTKDYPECQRDLEKIIDGSSREPQLWALKILDASTKFPSGILTGKFADYGSYDECFSVKENLETQYCSANIIPSDLPGLPKNLALNWAYCIPASCPASLLQNALSEALKEMKLNVTVTSKDCILNEPKTITSEDYIGIYLWSIFVALALLSTAYDVIIRRTDKPINPWLTSFSLYSNGMNLLKTEVTAETMTPLHGLRFLSICWVVLGHRYFFASSSSLINLSDYQAELEKIQSEFFIQGILAVDTFFLLSGLLNCFLLMKVLDKSGKFPYLMYYFHRYIRLTPALAAIVLMYATWYSYLGDGPAWEKTTVYWKQLCVENWWPTLLYINNYYNPFSQCAGQSWYLAVDMQLYWLSPLVIIPIWKWPKYKKIYLGGLLLASTLCQFIIAYVYKFRMSFTFGLE